MGTEELIIRKVELLNKVIEVNSQFDDEYSKSTVKSAKDRLNHLITHL